MLGVTTPAAEARRVNSRGFFADIRDFVGGRSAGYEQELRASVVSVGGPAVVLE